MRWGHGGGRDSQLQEGRQRGGSCFGSPFGSSGECRPELPQGPETPPQRDEHRRPHKLHVSVHSSVMYDAAKSGKKPGAPMDHGGEPGVSPDSCHADTRRVKCRHTAWQRGTSTTYATGETPDTEDHGPAIPFARNTQSRQPPEEAHQGLPGAGHGGGAENDGHWAAARGVF